jgi:hypothetical protein
VPVGRRRGHRGFVRWVGREASGASGEHERGTPLVDAVWGSHPVRRGMYV